MWVNEKGKPSSNAETACVTLLHVQIPKDLDTERPGSCSSSAMQFACFPSHQNSNGLKIQNCDKKRAGKWKRSIKRCKQFFKHYGCISPGKKKKRRERIRHKQDFFLFYSWHNLMRFEISTGRQSKITRLSSTLNFHTIYDAKFAGYAAHLHFHKVA